MLFPRKPKPTRTTDRVPALFGGAAEEADTLPRTTRQRLHELALRIAGATEVRGSILELGCRSGVLSLQIASELPGRQVTGLDPSTDAVRKAREVARDLLVYDRTTFDRSDLTKLAFPDRSAALVIGIDMLARSPSLPVLLAEVQRVLAPGGEAWLLDSLAEVGDGTGRKTRAELQAALDVARRRVSVRIESLDPEDPDLIALRLSN